MNAPSSLRPRFLLYYLILLQQCKYSHAFAPPALCRSSSPYTAIKVTAQSDQEEIQNLLERAKKLRQEADAAEIQLRTEHPPDAVASRLNVVGELSDVTYSTLDDSIWKVKYRFAEEAINRDENDDDDATLDFYRGEITLKFRSDGYTEIVNTGEGSQLEIEKVWGWDQELDAEDNEKRYLLFSMDAKTPTKKERFYFQAEIQKIQDKIKLVDGTVTIKEDLAKTKKVMNFGFFSPKGILAQFRNVGSFVAKPTR